MEVKKELRDKPVGDILIDLKQDKIYQKTSNDQYKEIPLTPLLDELTQNARNSPRLRAFKLLIENRHVWLHMINAIEPGSYVRPHMHPKSIEIFKVIRGKIGVVNFDEKGNVIKEAVLKRGQKFITPKKTFHTAVSLESGTVICDTSEGPYVAETYKKFADWSPEEGTPQAADYLKRLERMLDTK